MSWIKKIFKNSKQQPEEKSLEDMSKMQVPVDEVFVENLKKNGGIFIYCESLTDIIETIGKIVAENIENIDACITRLRVTVKDASIVADDARWKELQAKGVIRSGKGIQVVYGTQAETYKNQIREKYRI